MKFHIEIKCDGAAFEPDPSAELATILRRYVENTLEAGDVSDAVFFDANDNPVGRAWSGEDEEADTRETACILAALRYWQWKRIRTDSSQRAADTRDIETNGGTIKPLSDDEIDELFERINTGGVVV